MSTVSDPTAALEQCIRDYILRGWMVIARTPTTAQLGLQERGWFGAFRPEGGYNRTLYLAFTPSGEVEAIHSDGAQTHREVAWPPRPPAPPQPPAAERPLQVLVTLFLYGGGALIVLVAVGNALVGH